ncbi:MAG: hypothetical protein AAGB19_21770 [Cyanobacteria bacterium P01_F01_bin.3]
MKTSQHDKYQRTYFLSLFVWSAVAWVGLIAGPQAVAMVNQTAATSHVAQHIPKNYQKDYIDPLQQKIETLEASQGDSFIHQEEIDTLKETIEILKR